MNSFSIIHTPAVEKTCPICKKLFMVSAPESYVYKVRDSHKHVKFLCSWGCLRAWEKKHKCKSQEAKKKQIQKQLMGGL